MSLDGSLGDTQFNGDVFILFAVHKPAQNLRLSFTEVLSHSVTPSGPAYVLTCPYQVGLPAGRFRCGAKG